jgi:hypothetical protein
MAKSKSGKDLRAQAQDLLNELPDETASGRMVDDNGSPMSDEKFAKDKPEAMKGSSGMDPRQLAMQAEQDNQQAP